MTKEIEKIESGAWSVWVEDERLCFSYANQIHARIELSSSERLALAAQLTGTAKFPTFLDYCKQYSLSRREREVAQCLLSGMSDKEIGEQLRIAEKTVQTHVYKISIKTGSRNRTQTVVKLLGVLS